MVAKCYDALQPWPIRYDPESKIVLVVDALKVSAPSTQKQLEGAMRIVAQLPPTDLLKVFLECAERYASRPILVRNEPERYAGRLHENRKTDENGEITREFSTTFPAELRHFMGYQIPVSSESDSNLSELGSYELDSYGPGGRQLRAVTGTFFSCKEHGWESDDDPCPACEPAKAGEVR
jgi:hypothetical protein